ncbi:hypothetical protein ACQP0U_13905 [Micromonospora sp. CA-269861]|uniref:hypothetical protein n=1 Tax=Micromonospora sp. CA-269861 TaxID=3239968 RepID=UPI003D92E119
MKDGVRLINRVLLDESSFLWGSLGQTLFRPQPVEKKVKGETRTKSEGYDKEQQPSGIQLVQLPWQGEKLRGDIK